MDGRRKVHLNLTIQLIVLKNKQKDTNILSFSIIVDLVLKEKQKFESYN